LGLLLPVRLRLTAVPLGLTAVRLGLTGVGGLLTVAVRVLPAVVVVRGRGLLAVAAVLPVLLPGVVRGR
ncbi:hypothetical protein G3I76_57445, partial [Streptomyces sp. SID11233]|nr:hypothetical protein [Streptomyces sp. SID11233]